MELRRLGRSAVAVPAIGFGTSGLGGMPDTYGYDVAEERARATVRAVLARPDGFLDTSRLYGFGRAEVRIGAVVRELGGWPAGRVLSTKLDRDVATGRFDAGQARRSFEQSLSSSMSQVGKNMTASPRSSSGSGGGGFSGGGGGGGGGGSW